MSRGLVSPIYGTTEGGILRATITSLTETGVDSLIATVGTLADTASINFIAGSPFRVDLSSSPNILSANGVSTSTITARIYDQFNHPVRAGLSVNFSVEPDGIGTIVPVSSTNSSGECVVSFTAGRISGWANITATCGAEASGMTQIQMTPTNVGRILITNTGSSSLPADGLSSTRILARVLDTDGDLISDGTIVNFGFVTSTGAFLNPSWASTVSGSGSVDLVAATVTGVAQYYAYIGAVSSETLSVSFVPGAPSTIAFDSLAGISRIANGVSTYNDSFTVRDIYGNPVPTVLVNLSISSGDVSPTAVMTNINGRASFTVTSPMLIGLGILNASSGAASANKVITYTASPVDTIMLSVSPSNLPADGVSTATVRASLLQPGGSPASDGLLVQFRTNLGVITPSARTVDGSATATLRSSDINGTATIWAKYPTTNDSSFTTVLFSAGAASEMILTVTPDTGQSEVFF